MILQHYHFTYSKR